jgi:hypothetical protein
MRYHEFKPLKPFKASVLLKSDKSVVLILTWADSPTAASRNLAHLYGTGNVLNLSEISLTEAKEISPQDQQVKALQTRAKQMSQQAKLIKARQSVTKAQAQLSKAAASPATAEKQS